MLSESEAKTQALIMERLLFDNPVAVEKLRRGETWAFYDQTSQEVDDVLFLLDELNDLSLIDSVARSSNLLDEQNGAELPLDPDVVTDNIMELIDASRSEDPSRLERLRDYLRVEDDNEWHRIIVNLRDKLLTETTLAESPEPAGDLSDQTVFGVGRWLVGILTAPTDAELEVASSSNAALVNAINVLPLVDLERAQRIYMALFSGHARYYAVAARLAESGLPSFTYVHGTESAVLWNIGVHHQSEEVKEAARNALDQTIEEADRAVRENKRLIREGRYEYVDTSHRFTENLLVHLEHIRARAAES